MNKEEINERVRQLADEISDCFSCNEEIALSILTRRLAPLLERLEGAETENALLKRTATADGAYSFYKLYRECCRAVGLADGAAVEKVTGKVADLRAQLSTLTAQLREALEDSAMLRNELRDAGTLLGMAAEIGLGDSDYDLNTRRALRAAIDRAMQPKMEAQ